MNASYLTIIGVAAIMTSGCAAGIKVQTEMAQPTLSQYHTYFLLPGHPSGDVDLDHRVEADVAAALARRSWIEAPSDEAEAVVVVNAATSDKHTDAAFYEGWGGWGWQFTQRQTTGAVHEYKPGSFVIDIFDARTKQAVWRGMATEVSENHHADHASFTQAAIDKLFEQFPTIEEAGDAFQHTVAADEHTPRITFAESPAVLITVDGPPVYRVLPGTDLSRVVNTGAFIVRDDNGIHYLRVAGRWMQAYTLTGWWSPAGIVPAGLDGALAQATLAKTVSVTGTPQVDTEHNVSGEIPAVYVSSTPMHLIVTDGPPAFAPLAGTSVLYLKNTSAHVFKEPTDQELYVFVSGEWYRAWTTDGPWQRLSNGSVPADLATLSVE